MSDHDFPSTLRDGLWHTTTPSRYEQIRSAGWIVPNPPIPDTERWGASQGPDYYPYVRVLGGVSLFDFRDFDPDSYDAKYPMSNWRAFVPYRRECGAAIWIGLDRIKVLDTASGRSARTGVLPKLGPTGHDMELVACGTAKSW